MRLERKRNFYEIIVKRLLDIVFALVFILLFWWIYLVIALIVRVKMGKPILFVQPRPGMVKDGRETIFYMFKFRTMTNEKDEKGNLLPDDQRLPKFGSFLRSTSLDELPEIFSILKGDMSFVGPRPQLIKDMVFMTPQQRMRHTSRPGLTGLAQINGRNLISWKDKIEWDLKYIDNISFKTDFKILMKTILLVLKRSGITDGENATALDYGDELLKLNEISINQYNELQDRAIELMGEHRKNV